MTRILIAMAAILPAGEQEELRLARRVAAIDRGLVKACEELARRYHKQGQVEAACFFAECALGFGSRDEAIKLLKIDGELEVYLGRFRGGKVLEETTPIWSRLNRPAGEYKKVLEQVERKWWRERKAVGKEELRIFRDCLVKYEIAHRAHEYVRAIQEVNRLRQGMRLRAVLWDFEHSRRAILAASLVADIGCPFPPPGERCRLHKEECIQDFLRSLYYDPEVMKMVYENSRTFASLKNWVEMDLRAGGLMRLPLLNANARRLWLGHWERFRYEAIAYNLPQLPYRQDIPTPTERAAKKTVVQRWIDREETLEVGGKKIPLVRYPYENEVGLPNQMMTMVEAGWKVPPKKPPGLPIAVRFFGEARLTDIEATLTRKGEKAPGLWICTNGDGKLEPRYEFKWPTILLLPEGYLKKGVTYTVAVRCKVDGVPFERTWSFTTKKAER